MRMRPRTPLLSLMNWDGERQLTRDGFNESIIEYIHEHIGAKTFFVTHYQELTSLESSLEFNNVHVATFGAGWAGDLFTRSNQDLLINPTVSMLLRLLVYQQNFSGQIRF